MLNTLIRTGIYFIGALALTVIIESILAKLLFDDKKAVKLTALAQCVTNPIVNAALIITKCYAQGLVIPVLCLFEILTVVAEAAIYAKVLDRKTMSHPALFSILANVLSYALGHVVGSVLL